MPDPADFFPYRTRKLHVEGVELSALAEKYGTPLYIYSSEALLSSYRELAEGVREVRGQVCFALKANSNLSILRLLASEGEDLLCAWSEVVHHRRNVARLHFARKASSAS